MVMPIADDNSDRRIVPIVNYLLIAINVWVFLFFQRLGENQEFTYAWSTVPLEIVTGKDVVTEPRTVQDRETGKRIQVPGLQPTPGSVYFTLITSMFMHGSIMHILGNMLFLWIFGDNVEDYLGHARYLAFYLVCGIIASLCHVFTTVLLFGADSPEAKVPSLGASGAISGVLGGYVLLFPYRRVTVIMFRVLTQVPAWVAVGMWFAMQLLLSMRVFGGRGSDGVAYAAHIGGFLAGLVLIHVFGAGLEQPGPVTAPTEPPISRDEPW
jgi:membrane associated rhomboid family serine protease